MATVTTFAVRFDERTKQILCALLDNAISQTSQGITAGDYSEELLQQHEELMQVKRGILYSRPEETETEQVTEETETTTETPNFEGVDLDLS